MTAQYRQLTTKIRNEAGSCAVPRNNGHLHSREAEVVNKQWERFFIQARKQNSQQWYYKAQSGALIGLSSHFELFYFVIFLFIKICLDQSNSLWTDILMWKHE